MRFFTIIAILGHTNFATTGDGRPAENPAAALRPARYATVNYSKEDLLKFFKDQYRVSDEKAEQYYKKLMDKKELFATLKTSMPSTDYTGLSSTFSEMNPYTDDTSPNPRPQKAAKVPSSSEDESAYSYEPEYPAKK